MRPEEKMAWLDTLAVIAYFAEMTNVKSRTQNNSLLGIITDDVTPGMRVAGACVLSAWLDRDPDIRAQAKNPNEVCALVYAAMRREQSRSSPRSRYRGSSA